MMGGFSGLHPLVCFVYFTGFFSLAMLCFHPVFLLTGLAVMAALNRLAGEFAGSLKKAGHFLLFGLLAVLFNALISKRGETVLLEWVGQTVSLESLVYGGLMTGMILSVLLGFSYFNSVLPPGRFLCLFGSLFPRSALLFHMAMRFVPLFQRRLQEMLLIHKARGRSVFAGSVAERARNGMQLIQGLLSWSLEEALQTADSMKARGYGLPGKRSCYYPIRFGKRDGIHLSLLLLHLFVLFLAVFSGNVDYETYPVLERTLLDPREAAVFPVYLSFVAYPLWFEIKERAKWRRLKSDN